MLTEDESWNLTWKERMFKVSLGYTFFTPLYAMYLFRFMKEQPQHRNHALRRVFFMPIMSICMLGYSAKITQEFLKEMSNKYLGGITDYEIMNFEALYSQVKAQ